MRLLEHKNFKGSKWGNKIIRIAKECSSKVYGSEIKILPTITVCELNQLHLACFIFTRYISQDPLQNDRWTFSLTIRPFFYVFQNFFFVNFSKMSNRITALIRLWNHISQALISEMYGVYPISPNVRLVRNNCLNLAAVVATVAEWNEVVKRKRGYGIAKMVWRGEGRNTGIVFELSPSIQVSLCANQAAKRLRLWYLDNSITSNRVDSIASKTSSIYNSLSSPFLVWPPVFQRRKAKEFSFVVIVDFTMYNKVMTRH